jgi:hypothetical protein
VEKSRLISLEEAKFSIESWKSKLKSIKNKRIKP